ncbi:MAG: hypothetical protein RR413_09190 [Christensenellaceae bacterium]
MCSQLSTVLRSNFSVGEASTLERYFSSLIGNATNGITANRAAIAMGIPFGHVIKLFSRCYKLGLLSIDYAIRCPECSTIIKRFSSRNDDQGEDLYCYSCENNVSITTDNIEIIYKLSGDVFFPNGQQGQISSTDTVAQIDSLKSFIESGGDYNSLFFNPNMQELQVLQGMYQSIFAEQKNTKATGDALENLAVELFRTIHCVKATAIRTSENQIDCYTNNGFASLLPALGQHIVIECKNEKRTPGNTYLHKISGVIDTINGSVAKPVRLGMIISRTKPAKTVHNLAYIRYIKDGLRIITMCGDELEDILFNGRNLLELIEQKVDELQTQSANDLRAAGLYN